MLCRNGIWSLLEGNVLWEAGSRPEWEGGSLSWCPGKRKNGEGRGPGPTWCGERAPEVIKEKQDLGMPRVCLKPQDKSSVHTGAQRMEGEGMASVSISP